MTECEDEIKKTEEKINKFLQKHGKIANYVFNDPELDNMKRWNYVHRQELILGEITKEEYLMMESIYWDLIDFRETLSKRQQKLLREVLIHI